MVVASGLACRLNVCLQALQKCYAKNFYVSAKCKQRVETHVQSGGMLHVHVYT